MSNVVFNAAVRRIGDSVVEGIGGTDGRVVMGPKGTPNSFTPVELLLIAIGGCSGIDLCTLSRRDGLDVGAFELELRGSKPIDANRLNRISIEYSVPAAAPADVERLVAGVRELCTVALTVTDGCKVQDTLVEPH
jgi:putative redox protein